MANPQIKLKRSSTRNKRPTPANVPLGELALNTFDGYLYASKDVGLGTTVITVNPWRVGTGTNSYSIDFNAGNVGINSSSPIALLDVNGDANISGVLNVTSLVKRGGTSVQFLKADGSVDNSVYLTSDGDGSSLKGIVTGIQAGANIEILESSPGNFIVTSTATGSGGISAISVENDGISVGTGITTINFGTNLNVSASNGIATITASNVDDDGSTTDTHFLAISRSTTQLVAYPGQTNFIVDYNVGFVDIFLNGVRLTASEYIAENGTSIAVLESCFGGENVDIIAYDTKTTRTTTEFIAICGQREFVVDYNVGFLDIFVNGVRLTKSEYVATNGTSIILSEACFKGDNIDVIAYDNVENGVVRDMSDAPTNPDDPGIPGQTAYDLTYFYVCVAPNSWRRTYLHRW